MLSAVVLFGPSSGATPPFPGADKAVHLAVFALLAATARWRLGRSTALLAGLAGYAAVSEVVQAVALAARSGDVLDVVADLVGVALGWWAAGTLGRGRRGVTA